MRKSEVCPDCGRYKALGPDEAAHGGCDKWYAVRDPEAKAECEAVKAAREEYKMTMKVNFRGQLQ